MKLRPNSRTIWAISLPIIFAGVSESVVDVTDTMFLARYGVTELGAVGVADSIYELLIVLAIGLSEGAQIMMARRAGRGQTSAIGAVFQQLLAALTVLGVLVFAAVQLLSPLLTSWLLSSDGVRASVDGFLRILAFGIVFDFANLAWGAYFVGVSRTRSLIGATIVLALINVVLDWILIFGRFGLPELGIEGAAIASVAAEVGAFLVLTAYAFRSGLARDHGLFRWRRRKGALFRRLAWLSGPIALETAVVSGRWFVFFVVVEHLGETALAASNLVYACFVVFLIPVEGFSETVNTMVSNLIGQRHGARIWLPITRALRLGVVVTAPFAILAFLFPSAVLGVLTSDPMTVAEGAGSLRWVALALLAVVPGELFLSAVSGTGDTRSAFWIEVAMSTATLTHVLLVTLVFQLSLSWVWLALPVAWSVRAVLGWACLRRGHWKEIRA